VNIAQLKNMSFDEFQRAIPYINPTDRLTTRDLLEETILRISDVNIQQEAEDEAESLFQELEDKHDSIVDLKDEEISDLKTTIEDLKYSITEQFLSNDLVGAGHVFAPVPQHQGILVAEQPVVFHKTGVEIGFILHL